MKKASPQADEFQPGELVQLLSGGPVMTIKIIHTSGDHRIPTLQDGDVECQWFNGKKLEQGYFPPSSLKKAGQDETIP